MDLKRFQILTATSTDDGRQYGPTKEYHLDETDDLNEAEFMLELHQIKYPDARIIDLHA